MNMKLNMKLNDINNNIDRLKLDVSNNLQMINELKQLYVLY